MWVRHFQPEGDLLGSGSGICWGVGLGVTGCCYLLCQAYGDLKLVPRILIHLGLWPYTCLRRLKVV